jgi:hypothetical protein
MIQRGSGFGFLDEAAPAILVAGLVVRKNLDRHQTVEPRIAGLEYLAHAAGADGRKDFVRSESVAGRKRHLRESVQFI